MINNFAPGDRIFLFGFSRGAYTARAVASLLRMYGLLGKGNEPLVPYAIRMLNSISALDEQARAAGRSSQRAKAVVARITELMDAREKMLKLQLADRLSVLAGRPAGQDEKFWFEAEAIVRDGSPSGMDI